MKQRYWIALAAALCLSMSAAIAEPTQVAVDLLAVDHKLYELGYRDSACNGMLNEVTINALHNFQLANGLEPTGQPDAETVELLLSGDGVRQSDYLAMLAEQNGAVAALSNGSTGDAVVQLQRALQDFGYFSGAADGAFGDATEAAVCRFQLANGLQETGVADGAVQLRLYEGTPVVWMDFLQDSCAAVGDSGRHVRTIQLWLQRKGYFQGECTGRYGDGTQQAVKRFQNENGLEASGDVNLETSRALFADVKLPGSAPIRRGDTGVEAENLCRDLALLGYPAHGRFNMQTELALLQFQQACGLELTGVADEATLERLHGESAVLRADYALPDLETVSEEVQLRIARRALALLGQMCEMDDDFNLVQYVYMQCGVPLMDRSQLSRVQLGAADAINAGDIVSVQLDGRQLYGVATADRALVCRAENGYIVMRYLDAMQPEAMWLYLPA